MIRKLKNPQGMTIVEIIIALAIFGILMVSLIPMFSSSFSNLIFMGNHSRANIEAQQIMDRIYEEARFTDLAGLEADVEAVLTDIVGAGSYENCTGDTAAYNAAYNSIRVRFMVSEDSSMLIDSTTPTVTLKLFYQEGRGFVTLTSPIVNGSQ